MSSPYSPDTPYPPDTHFPVIVIGGGQAGLSMSYWLQQQNLRHLVLEAADRPMHAWRDKRWDSFTLVTPNWQCDLPGHPYRGSDPHGFMNKTEILDYLAAFEHKVQAPLLPRTRVNRLAPMPGGDYALETSGGRFTAQQVVIATGGYQQPLIPRLAERLPDEIQQLHSEQYRNSDQIRAGAVLVVGSGQSGAQIAEDLHLSGRQVYLATGNAPRCARFYRGRDVVAWLANMDYYDIPVEQHPLREGVRDNSNHYVTGRDGGRDIDLRRFALQGMELFGQLHDYRNGELHFDPTLKHNLDQADATFNNINARIDAFIENQGIDAPPGDTYQPPWQPAQERTQLDLAAAGIGSVIWSIGYQPDYRWIDIPIFNGRGYPQHRRGVTAASGLYFLGLPWLHTWGSGRFAAVGRDARYLGERIATTRQPNEAAVKVGEPA